MNAATPPGSRGRSALCAGESPHPQLGAPLFAAVVKAEDGTRPTAANTPGWHGPYPPYVATDLLTRNIDIQGFSHAGAQQGDSNAHLGGNPALGRIPNTPAIFHNVTRYKAKPVFGSECCSCNTMRDEEVGCEAPQTRTPNPQPPTQTPKPPNPQPPTPNPKTQTPNRARVILLIPLACLHMLQ